eukprot:365573-Chlamydomonas_euryale.AAC.5
MNTKGPTAPLSSTLRTPKQAFLAYLVALRSNSSNSVDASTAGMASFAETCLYAGLADGLSPAAGRASPTATRTVARATAGVWGVEKRGNGGAGASVATGNGAGIAQQARACGGGTKGSVPAAFARRGHVRAVGCGLKRSDALRCGHGRSRGRGSCCNCNPARSAGMY